MTRELFVAAVISQVGAPYQYGAQHPTVGFDCSGLVVWALKIPDTNAMGLYKRYSKKTISHSVVRPGSLWFYGKPINHVMVCIRRWGNGACVLVGARGGTSRTNTLCKAETNGAFVDTVLASKYQPENLNCVVDPF